MIDIKTGNFDVCFNEFIGYWTAEYVYPNGEEFKHFGEGDTHEKAMVSLMEYIAEFNGEETEENENIINITEGKMIISFCDSVDKWITHYVLPNGEILDYYGMGTTIDKSIIDINRIIIDYNNEKENMGEV